MHRFAFLFAALLAVVFAAAVPAQTPKDVRQVAKQGPTAIPTVAQYLNSAAVDTRVEVVKQLVALGGRETIDPLIRATRDPDAEVQIRATDALVNFYLPGYVRQGIGSSLVRAGDSVRAHFSDYNDQTIDGFVIVRPEVIAALGALARGGASYDVRANACRAVGILRGREAVPDLIDALRTKDNRIMFEALVAMQKIRDPEAGPRVAYLVRDLDDKVQSAAIETVGVLRAKDALPALRDIAKKPRNAKAERSALAAIALMPEPQDRALLTAYLGSKDDKLRGSAAEGLGRIGDPADKAALAETWKSEEKMVPRLGAAFGLVLDGDLGLGEDAPLRYLINTLNSASYKDYAVAYLIEAARKPSVRSALYQPIEQGTRDEKIQLAKILSASGDEQSIPYLEKVSRDPDADVAQEGLRALRSLRARLKV
jgi:HEAT repeat protein